MSGHEKGPAERTGPGYVSGMYIEGFALFGAVLTAVGVALMGAGATDGLLRRKDGFTFGPAWLWEWCTFVGTAAGIVGAVLTVISLVIQ